MASCDGFEIEIEKRLHGALGEAEALRLDAHLSTCERCRAFEATGRLTEAAMRGAADEAVRGVDWAQVERAIGAWRRRSLVGLGTWAVLVIVVAGQAWRHRGEQGVAGISLLATGLLLVGWGGYLVVGLLRRRRAGGLARGATLLEVLRTELAERRRAARRALAIFPVLALFFAWQAFTTSEPGRRPLLAISVCICVATWLAIWLVKRPRLAREQVALDGATGIPGA